MGRLLKRSVWNSIKKYVLYCPASVASNNHCPGLAHLYDQTCHLHGLQFSFRPVNGSSLAESFLGLTPLKVLRWLTSLLDCWLEHYQLWPDNLLKSCCQTLLLGDEERKKDPVHKRADLLEVLQPNMGVYNRSPLNKAFFPKSSVCRVSLICWFLRKKSSPISDFFS